MSTNLRTTEISRLTTTLVSNLSNYTSHGSKMTTRTLPELLGTIAFCILVLFICIGVLGNAVLCLTVVKCRDMRGGTYFLIINLAIANLGVSLFCMPFCMVSLWYNAWILGDTMCIINGFSNLFWLTASLFSFAALSLHKYFVIVRPLKRSQNRRRLWVLMALTWIISSACATVPMLALPRTRYYESIALCGPDISGNKRGTLLLVFITIVLYALPISVVIISFWRVLRAIRGHTRRLTFHAITEDNSHKATWHFLMTLRIMAVSYVVSWSPSFVIGIFVLSKRIDLLPQVYPMVALLLAFSTCAQNIFILYLRNNKLRRKSTNIIGSLVCKCCKASGYNVAFREFKNATLGRKGAAGVAEPQSSNWYVESSFIQDSVDCLLSVDEYEAQVAVIRKGSQLESIM